MTDTMTTTEHAAAIRTTLKERYGWSSRKVSVKADYYSMGSSIDIVVKDPDVPLATVKAVAEGAERIDYCKYSGEILSGGNRYVHVRHSHEAEQALAERYVAAVLEAANKVMAGSSTLERVGDTEFWVGKPNLGDEVYGLHLWTDTHIAQGGGGHLAYIIGRMVVNAKYGLPMQDAEVTT